MMISIEYKDRGLSTSVDLSKGIAVCPLLSFYFFIFLFFLFFVFFGGLNGSFYLTLICIFHTLQRYSHKEDITIMMQMYASARIAGYAMILARHVAMIRARSN